MNGNFDCGKLQNLEYGISPAGDSRSYPFLTPIQTEGLDLTPVGPPSDLHIEMMDGGQHGGSGDGGRDNLVPNTFPDTEPRNRLPLNSVDAHHLMSNSRGVAYNTTGQPQAMNYMTGLDGDNHFPAPHYPPPEYSDRRHYQYSEPYCQPFMDFSNSALESPPVNFDRSFPEAGYRTGNPFLGAHIQPPVLPASPSPGPVSPVKSPR